MLGIGLLGSLDKKTLVAATTRVFSCLFHTILYNPRQNMGVFMDTTKWKSVLVPRDTYDEIVAIAYIEGRTISGQLRMMFDNWKHAKLSRNDLRILADVVHKNKMMEEKERKDAMEEAVRQALHGSSEEE